MHNYSTATGAFPPGIGNTTAYLGMSPPSSLSTWTAWSAQALLLPYVEQGAMYNAANFSWTCCYVGPQANAVNSTVYNLRIASFLCPSDAIAGQQNINSYLGCIGTSTIQYPADGNTTGIFRVYNSVNSCTSVTLAAVTDGTSNTIAFGEGLVGDFGKNDSYRGNGMSGASDPTGGIVPATMPGNNAETNPQAVIQALQSCNTFWRSNALATCSGYSACDNVGLKQYNGQLWALGERGYTLFNTIVPPNSQQYPWRSCRLGASCPSWRRRARASSMRAASTPAGATSHFPTAASGSSRIRSTC